MQTKYEIKHTIRTYDIDFKKRLRYANLLKYMQDAAQVHATNLGIGHAYLEKIHYAWILGRLKIQMHTIPHLGDTLILTTFPGPRMKYVYPRYFIFKDEKGNILGSASSLWTIFDTQKREVVMTQEYIPYPEIDFFERPLANPGQIELLDLDKKANYQIQYSDVDTNIHANNTNYAEWLFNLFDLDFLTNHYPNEIQINYLHEIAFQQKFDIHYTIQPHLAQFVGQNGNQTLFSCEMKIKEEDL